MEFYATLGDPCARRDILDQMFQAGMTGIRVNLSHTSLTQCAPLLQELYWPSARGAGRGNAHLILDLQGPELRVGELPRPISLREGEELSGDGGERALCSNACLLARALERTEDRTPVFQGGREVLAGLTVEEHSAWAEFVCSRSGGHTADLCGQLFFFQIPKGVTTAHLRELYWTTPGGFAHHPKRRQPLHMEEITSSPLAWK